MNDQAGAATEPSTARTTDPLQGDRLLLMPVHPDDHRYLFWLASASENAFRWRYRLQLPPYEIFIQQLHADVLAQFVVHDRGLNARIGHVVAYGADLRSGIAYVGAVMSPDVLGSGLGREALDVFCAYLLRTWPLRKVYAEVPDFTFKYFEDAKHEFGSRDHMQWQYEATLRDHLYCDGRYWDMHYVSLSGR